MWNHEEPMPPYYLDLDSEEHKNREAKRESAAETAREDRKERKRERQRK